MIAILNAHSLTARDRFLPESMSLQISERTSTATLSVSTDGPVPNVGDWARIEDGPGEGTVWRVRAVETQIERKSVTVSLEHIINTLHDTIIFGEVKAGDMGGGDTVAARTAARYVLGRQNDWVLGDFAYSVSNPYSFNGDDLYSAMETISNTLSGCLWEYSVTSYPFTLHIHQLSDEIASEMRTDRNIRTLRKTVDRGRMYTRHYPIGKNNLHISGEYVSKNESIYGTICKTETNNGIEDEAELRAWATERLNRHCDPSVTVSISGLDLSEVTGEPLDSFRIGKMCRVPLPEFGTTITEKVTKLSYSDAVADPMSVTITLANELPDLATILKQEVVGSSSSLAKSGRAGAKKNEEDHAWFVDTTDHVGMVAEAVAGEGADKDWSRVAEVIVDGNGIHQRVVETEGELVTHESRIEATENAIEQEVIARTKEGEELSGKITVEAGKINQVVRAVGKDGKVTAASICLAINEGGSSATINADKIYLLGQTIANQITADYISSKIANMSVLTVNALRSTGNIVAGSGGYVMAPYYYIGTAGSAVSMASAIKALQITLTGDTYKLQKQDFDDSGWVDVGTFSRAVSSWTVGGGSGKVTVKANPQNQTKGVNVSVSGSNSISNNGTYTYKVMYEKDDGDDAETGASISVNVSVHPDSMSITRAIAYKSSGGNQYYGRLYYYDATSNVYRAASDSDHYWYYSNTNRSGTNTVWY